jgi:hypothetical protein
MAVLEATHRLAHGYEEQFSTRNAAIPQRD